MKRTSGSMRIGSEEMRKEKGGEKERGNDENGWKKDEIHRGFRRQATFRQSLTAR